MHPALAAAASAVRRDLRTPAYEQAVADAVELRAWWLSEWEAGAP